MSSRQSLIVLANNIPQMLEVNRCTTLHRQHHCVLKVIMLGVERNFPFITILDMKQIISITRLNLVQMHIFCKCSKSSVMETENIYSRWRSAWQPGNCCNFSVPIIYVFTNRTPAEAGAIGKWMNFAKVIAYKIIKAPIQTRSAHLGSDQVSGAIILELRWRSG